MKRKLAKVKIEYRPEPRRSRHETPSPVALTAGIGTAVAIGFLNIVIFGGIRGPEWATLQVSIIVPSISIAVFCFFIPVPRIFRRRVTLFIISVTPTACIAVLMAVFTTVLGSRAPREFFRTRISDPIPESVQNVHFLTIDEKKGELAARPVLRFSISKGDMDNILQKNGYERKRLDDLYAKEDPFSNISYLPFGSDDEVYQRRSNLDATYTLKLSGDHKQALFKFEPDPPESR